MPKPTHLELGMARIDASEHSSNNGTHRRNENMYLLHALVRHSPKFPAELEMAQTGVAFRKHLTGHLTAFFRLEARACFMTSP